MIDKTTIIAVLIVPIVSVLMACGVFFAIYGVGWHWRSHSENEELGAYEEGTVYELLEDVFIMASDPGVKSKNGYLVSPSSKKSCPRIFSSPPTIESWEKKLVNIDKWDGKWAQSNGVVNAERIIGVVRRGTKVRFLHTITHMSISVWHGYSKYDSPIAKILGGKCEGWVVDISDISDWYPQKHMCNRFLRKSMPETPPHSGVMRVKMKIQGHDPIVETSVTLHTNPIDIVCGFDSSTMYRYDVRNDALLSIARRRDLPEGDIVALMDYVASTACVMRVEREAALKNDVLNLLRNQKQQPEGLEDLLLDMVAAKQYAPVIIDYCIQHLGAMVGSVSDDQTKARIREAFVAAAKDIGESYAGTALYSLAELPNKSKSESDELRRLTVAACGDNANPVARISAIQLAGERGYREVLPALHDILAGTRRDAVLDTVVVGSIGLLGDASDIHLLESFRPRGGRRLKTAIDSAVQRIKERGSAMQAK